MNKSENIEFDFYNVETQIKKLEQLIFKFQRLTERNQENISKIQSNWEGESSQLYNQKMLKQREKLEVTLGKLRAVKEALENSCKTAKEAETAAKETVTN